jgi:ATP-dependent Clp protease protease subunit
LKTELAQTLADNSGQTLEKVLSDIDRDNWMNPIQAKEYGLIDKILNKRK